MSVFALKRPSHVLYERCDVCRAYVEICTPWTNQSHEEKYRPKGSWPAEDASGGGGSAPSQLLVLLAVLLECQASLSATLSMGGERIERSGRLVCGRLVWFVRGALALLIL